MFFILTLKLCTAADLARGHCFSVWKFPWPQNCGRHAISVPSSNFRVKAVQASFHPDPSPKAIEPKAIEDKPRFETPPNIPDIPGPTESDIQWWDAVAKLKPLLGEKP